MRGIFWFTRSAIIPLRPIEMGVKPAVRVMSKPNTLPLISLGMTIWSSVYILIWKNPLKAPIIIIKTRASTGSRKMLNMGKQKDIRTSAEIRALLRI